MTLLSLGRLYVGLADVKSYDAFRSPTSLCVHIGTLRIEWDCPTRTPHGPITESTH
jgi:hypothetical protein